MKCKLSKFLPFVLLLAVCVCALTGCGEEKKAAKADYQAEYERITSECEVLNTTISQCEELLNSNPIPYDADTISALETATTDARASIKEIPKCPSKTEDINALVADTLKGISYSGTNENLISAKIDLENSVKIMEQITNPSEEFVINGLKKIKGITGYDAATEDNDPNENLHKPGGYTSAVYFAYDKVDKTFLFGDSIIEMGTDCGGQIEVYATAEDAQKRCDYLSTFDGGFLSSGSHTVLGTMLIRTSHKLTATQQNELEAALIKVYTTLPE